jgi:hypothetical protein
MFDNRWFDFWDFPEQEDDNDTENPEYGREKP